MLLSAIAGLLALQWIYAPAPSPLLDEMAREPMRFPSPERMTVLCRLVQIGNMRDVAQWTEQIAALDPGYRPFANQIFALAKRYECQELLKLVNRYVTSPEM
ncbi:hypothetical protein AYM40_07165 [Paraburkholderia phytofirmans OLGA172]|uniref:Uncharacterized protein n=1 Tax=Paraburkholderia phytofirmans OLGA172 TaxID=1417228 RepID=A0A160FIR7_9BURK|nr:hypothetical protein [Paraburkholderia phytofirmans]ANB72170.1 hypothetical protein AYM40_07165 [Paraburkholderia phytofirmans OLGA172]